MDKASVSMARFPQSIFILVRPKSGSEKHAARAAWQRVMFEVLAKI